MTRDQYDDLEEYEFETIQRELQHKLKMKLSLTVVKIEKDVPKFHGVYNIPEFHDNPDGDMSSSEEF